MGDVVDLKLVRKEKGTSATDWTPLDALKDAVMRIEKGEWKPSCVVVSMIEDEEDGGRVLWECAGLSKPEMIWLLELHKFHHLTAEEGE